MPRQITAGLLVLGYLAQFRSAKKKVCRRSDDQIVVLVHNGITTFHYPNTGLSTDSAFLYNYKYPRRTLDHRDSFFEHYYSVLRTLPPLKCQVLDYLHSLCENVPRPHTPCRQEADVVLLLLRRRRLRDGSGRRAEWWSADPDQDIDATRSPHCPLRDIRIDAVQHIPSEHEILSYVCPENRVI